MKKVLVLYLTRNGASARAAREAGDLLRKAGHRVETEELRARIRLPYPLWLLWSFIPGIGAPIMPLAREPGNFDAMVLAFPKWTVNCPPVTGFLAKYASRLPPLFLIVTMGGWDGPRYAGSYAKKLAAHGAAVRGVAVLKRKCVGLAQSEGSRGSLRAYFAKLEGVFP